MWAVVLLALVPFSAVLCLPELSTFQLGKAVLVGPLLAVLLIGGAGRGIWPGRLVLGAAILVVLVGLGALLRSPSPGVGAWELWLDLLFLGAMLAGARIGPPRRLFMGVAGAGGLLVTVTALEMAGVGPLCPAAVAQAGTMGNPNFTGALLALAAPACLALALGSRSRWRTAAWTGLILASLASLAVLGSWTGAVGAGFGLSAVALHALTRRGRRRTALGLTLVILGVAGGALTSPTVRDHLADRGYMARCAAGAAAERPLAGSGLGGFPRAFLEAQAELLEAHPEERGRWTRALHAHSEPLHALVERGILGMLVWLALWGVILWSLLATRGRSPGRAGLTGILVAGLALSLGEFPGHLVPVQLTLGLAVGGMSAPTDSPASEPHPGSSRARVLVWLLAIPLFLVPPWLALSDRALTRGDPSTALEINPWNGRAAFSVALAEQDGLAPTGCTYALLADRLLPSPASAMTLGLCAARSEHRNAGIAALRRAVRWNPRSAAAHGNLALLLVASGDKEGARRHALRATSLRPGDPRIREILDRVEAETAASSADQR